MFLYVRLRGATVARLTPDQKVACSNHVGVKGKHFENHLLRQFSLLGTGFVVKTACLERRRSWARTPLALSFKEIKCYTRLTREDSILWGSPVTERLRARPQTARYLISNPVIEDSVISFVSPFLEGSSGPVWPICAQRRPNTPFISFYLLFNPYRADLFV